MNPLLQFKNIDEDFFKLNPQLKIGLFNKISSKTMWLLSFIVEEENNAFYNIPIEERVSFLSKEFNITIPKNIEDLIAKYSEVRLSYIERKLVNWKKKLDERDTFLEDIKYDDTTYEMLDKMMSTTDKLLKQYLLLKAQAHNDGTTQGIAGKEASLSDKGEI